jgi:hydroxymethylpyrimidine/phosphomethylpyrimidine kinase
MKGRVLIIAGSDSGGGAGILAAIEHPSVIAKIHGRRPALAVGGV